MSESPTPPVCDYEGSGYERDFWQGQGRDYEDLAERFALRKLLPESGRRVLEIGAGYGRLTDELAGFDHVVLLDYSRTLLARARERLGDSRCTYVAADVYRMPFQPGSFDAATMIRVIHHMADVPAVLASIREALAPGATFILEYANKRNLKAILRHALGRQDWNPHDRAPVEFVELNFDFHPAYMAAVVRETGFDDKRRLAVSYFRLRLLKRLVPAGVLAGLDGLLQSRMPLYSPSVFTLNRASDEGADFSTAPLRFYCPLCGAPLDEREGSVLCHGADCGHRFAIRDGIYDFKEPVS